MQMESMTIKIKDSKKVKFIRNLLNEFNFVEVIENKNGKHSSELKQRLREGFHAIRLHEEGKIKLKSGQDILNEI